MLFYMHQQYMISVPNMNKINQFFYEMSQQPHKMYEKVTIITQIWHRAKCYFPGMSNTWYLVTLPNIITIITFFSEISQQTLQTLKIYKKIDTTTQIWHWTKFYFTCISSTCTWSLYQIWRIPSQPSWGQTNRWIDWQTRHIPIFSKE